MPGITEKWSVTATFPHRNYWQNAGNYSGFPAVIDSYSTCYHQKRMGFYLPSQKWTSSWCSNHPRNIAQCSPTHQKRIPRSRSRSRLNPHKLHAQPITSFCCHGYHPWWYCWCHLLLFLLPKWLDWQWHFLLLAALHGAVVTQKVDFTPSGTVLLITYSSKSH